MAVVSSAMPAATGSEPDSRCHTGTSREPPAARVISAHGWKTSQPGMPNRSARRPPARNQPAG